ncbi:MAG: hypothetical protein RL514_3152 [Verrucomicrobiota bacterium]|jgi:hypothetical protein
MSGGGGSHLEAFLHGTERMASTPLSASNFLSASA